MTETEKILIEKNFMNTTNTTNNTNKKNKIRFAFFVLILGVSLSGLCFTSFAQTDGLTAQSAEQPTENLIAQLTAQPADQPTAQPTENLTAQQTAQPTDQPTENQTEPFSTEIIRARVLGIASEKETISSPGVKKLIQNYEFEVLTGSIKGKNIQIAIEPDTMIGKPEFKKGDVVLISHDTRPDGTENFFVLDFVRSAPLYWLFAIFVIITIVVGRWYGLSSLIGLVISFAIIFMLILPLIISGFDPVAAAILGSIIIIPATFYLSHGLNKKTSIAITGTIISLIFTGILAVIFVEISKLTGLASEESGFVLTEISGMINMKGLLLAGIIIGTLGVLDDLTISQSAIVLELKKANSKMGFSELYKSAMRVGRDHIASMVNTLVLVYTGAALPLLMLFINANSGFTEVINYEILATEIIRTLVGSIGLILSVPVTTALAALVLERKAAAKAKIL